MAERRRERARGRARPWVRVLLAVALVLVGLELALPRVCAYGRGPLVVGSQRFGHRLLGAQSVLGPQGVREHVNARGFRDEDFAPPLFARREAGVLRVALLGGSAVYGRGVPEPALLARRLQRELAQELERREDARRPQVMSFAVPGYGLQACVRVWADEAGPYAPDLAVLCLGSDSIRPVVPSPEPSASSAAATIGRSALGDWLLHGLLGRPRLDPERDPSPLGDVLARDPLAPQLAPAWEDARARLPRLDEALRAAGTRLLVLAVPTEPGGAAAAQRWVELCRAAGIPAADASEGFARDAAAGDAPLVPDGRGLSEAGHRRATQAVLAALLEHELL